MTKGLEVKGSDPVLMADRIDEISVAFGDSLSNGSDHLEQKMFKVGRVLNQVPSNRLLLLKGRILHSRRLIFIVA